MGRSQAWTEATDSAPKSGSSSGRTGLKGSFDVDLEWASDPGSDKPSIFTAVQEQLGLKLEFERNPVDVLVIDHVERPTED